MTEKQSSLNQETQHHDEQLVGADNIHEKLMTLLETEEEFAAEVDGLYICSPGSSYFGESIVDNGCRGGWTDHYSVNMAEDPYAVASIERRNTLLVLRLKNQGKLTLRPEALQQAQFYIDPSLWREAAEASSMDNTVRDLLQEHPYTSFTSEDLDVLTDWRHTVAVRPRSALNNPVYYRRRNFNGTLECVPLQGDFEQVRTYYDSEHEKYMAQVVVRDYKQREVEATAWIPLDHLSFYEARLSDFSAYQRRMSRLTFSLLNGNRDTEAINEALKETPSIYSLWRKTVTGGGAHQPVIVGKVKDDQITDIQLAPASTENNFGRITHPAEEVVYDHNRAWVVNSNGTSIPLQPEGQFEMKREAPLFGEDIEELIKAAQRYAK